jgi:hypothetical protein
MLASCLLAGAARGSEPDLFGFGMRSPAMAGTGVASADDYEATYANPAGLAFGHRRTLTFGYAGAHYGLHLDGADRAVDDTNGLILGVQLPIPLGDALAGRLALGLGLYLPAGVVNRARAAFPEVPTLALLDNRTQTVSISVGAGVRLHERVAIGAGVLALAALVGTIHLGVDGAGRVTSQAEEQLIANFAPIVGARWDVTQRFHLGAVFRGRSQSRYDITVDSNLRGVIPFDLPKIRFAGTSQYDPLQAALEATFSPADGWLLAANLTYQRWSDFAPPSEQATAESPPTPGSRCPAQGDMPDANCFADRVIPRVALEWRHAGQLIDAALRAGYFFAWSPAPDAAPARTLLDASRHVVTIGAELALRRWVPLRLTAFYQWHQLQANERVSGSFAVGGLSLGVDL